MLHAEIISNLQYLWTNLRESLLSLNMSQVMVGTGRVCVYRVGGIEESSRYDSEVLPRWELFIGDKPHEQCDEELKLRPPMQQIASIEADCIAGAVVVSQETVEVRVQDVHGSHLRRTKDIGASLNSSIPITFFRYILDTVEPFGVIADHWPQNHKQYCTSSAHTRNIGEIVFPVLYDLGNDFDSVNLFG